MSEYDIQKQKENDSAMHDLFKALRKANGKTWRQIEVEIEKECESDLFELTQCALKHAPNLINQFTLKSFGISLFVIDGNGEEVAVEIRVQSPEQGSYSSEIKVPKNILTHKEKIKDEFLYALIKNSYFSDGFDPQRVDIDQPAYPEELDMFNFYNALEHSGPMGLKLKQWLDLEEQWKGHRWQAERWLTEQIKNAAQLGLIPAKLEDSRIMLSRGLPGEPTALITWDHSYLSGMSGYRGGQSSDVLGCRREKAFLGHAETWALPSLTEGKEAIWSALCEKIAEAHELDWPGINVCFQSDKEVFLAAMEKQVLLHETAPVKSVIHQSDTPSGPRQEEGSHQPRRHAL